MYIERITIDNKLSDNKLSELVRIAEECFNNRICKIHNSGEGNLLVFKGNSDKELCAIGIGAVALYRNKSFLKHVVKWTYEDTNEPGDCSDDVIASFQYGEKLCQGNR